MEFLFENPILLIILIGIISSMFKQNKEKQPANRRQQPKRPTIDPISGNGQNERYDRNQRGDRSQSAQRKPNGPRTKPKPIPVNEFKEELANQWTDSPRTPPEYSQSVVKEKDETTFSKQKQLEVEQSRLIDGIIWSEVLGPPRAKSPHRSIKKVR